MNRYIMIRRLRGPVFLLLVGALALLNQAHILGWHQSWPFFLIFWGVMMLAERAALAADGSYPPGPYQGQNQPPNQEQYPGAVDPAAAANQAHSPAPPGSAIVSSPVYGLIRESDDPKGGQS